MVGCTGGLEVERHQVALVMDPVERLLILLRRKLLIGQLLAMPGRHQQKWVEGHRTQVNGQLEDMMKIGFSISAISSIT